MSLRTGLLCLLLCLTEGACASRAVRCDRDLQPINAPAPEEHRASGAAARHDGGELP
jgi:hypothetical protein